MKPIKIFSRVLKKWPGEKQFGAYRFLPVFFISGMALEFAMIHWRPNGVNFYESFKKKKAHEVALERYAKWKEIEELCK